jgi:hypothetical protein
MQVLQYYKKGSHMNTIDRFHIHVEFTANNHLNDEHTIFLNVIFDTLLKTHQPQTATQRMDIPQHSNTKHYFH